MGLSAELKYNRPARRFFDQHAKHGVHAVAEELVPLGALVIAPPDYQHTECFRLAGTMTDALVRYDLLRARYNVQHTATYYAAAGPNPGADIAQCLAQIAHGHLELQPQADDPTALTAAFALAIGEDFFRSGSWPKAFIQAVDAAGGTTLAPGCAPTESDLRAVATGLEAYWRAIEGELLFADVAGVLGAWGHHRSDPHHEFSAFALQCQNPQLEHAAAIGGADPDLHVSIGPTETLLDTKTITGCATPDDVRQLTGYLMLRGSHIAGVTHAGFLYPRRCEVRMITVDTLFHRLFGCGNQQEWSDLFVRYVRESYLLAS